MLLRKSLGVDWNVFDETIEDVFSDENLFNKRQVLISGLMAGGRLDN